jgi:hypothetical protein
MKSHTYELLIGDELICRTKSGKRAFEIFDSFRHLEERHGEIARLIRDDGQLMEARIEYQPWRKLASKA